MTRRLLSAIVAGMLVGTLAGCLALPRTVDGTPPATPERPTGVQPTGVVTDVATGLAAPWSLLRIPLDDGAVTLVSERDSGTVQRVLDDGSLESVGTIPGVAHSGEGGLLGLAHLDDGEARWLYAYLTTATDNRIIRLALNNEFVVGDEPEVVVGGIPRAGNHNGGRIAFGPDGLLYATTGDAGNPDSAQDPAALSGKILRMTPTGQVPAGNPMSGSLVYSMGHRNPQGIAWDDDGQLWASEFGQNTWDEFNRIEPGGNYGWPVVEGQVGDDAYIDPVLQWQPSEASPSGLTWIDGTFFMASLRGARIWAIYVDGDTASAVDWFAGEYGRIRDVSAGAEGSLWIVTNNTDGRGSPRDGDDRILQVPLADVEGR